jgi:uncharacterized surface protein with fasciclin (FAS1) repeats
MSKRLILLTMLMLVALVAAACGGTAAVTPTEEAPMATEEPMAAASIAEIAAGDENFSTLVAALSAAGLVDTLAGEGQFTVFAPTNDAFAALPAGTVDALLADPSGDLTQILLYHVVDGVALAEDVVGLESVTTLNGAPISIEVVDGGVVLNGTVNVTTTDIMASNGVIHVIDAVLLPPADEMMAPDMSIAEIAAGDENFSTLVAALSAAGLVDTLAGEGQFTVFAPTNDAFAALPAGTVDTLLADPSGDLTQILLYHVVDGVALAEDVVGLESVTTLNGAPISIAVVDGGVVLNDGVRVTTTDIAATNGVIHVIDAVLLPPADEVMAPDMSIAEIAAGDENFSTLVAALSAAGLVDTLAGEGQFTVFAPTNDAFAALPEGTVDTLLADPSGDLTQILLYHVVDGVAMAEDVVGLESVTTLNGAPISIEVVDDGVVLNGTVNVTATDIAATNGVIHVIDAVLLPPAEAAMTEDMSIAAIVAGNADFSTLLAALQAAGLDATLAAEGEYTVFAPTNEAFAALPAGTLDTLLADPSGDLTQILLYHVLQGVATADDVVSLTSAQALQGSPITIEVTDEGVVLNGSVLVTQTNIVANNGVIHVINAVLLPPAE